MQAFPMEDKSVYHERQRLQFCLLHALNNLLQEQDSFTRAELDAIAEKLNHDDPDKGRWTPLSVIFNPLGPHHNRITGNYDVNVLISALEARNLKVVWHDHRNSSCSINLSSETLLGILLNIPVRRFAGLWRSRHWVSIRCVDGIWYNLDSDLASPKPFRDLDELTVFFDHAMGQGAEILLVFHDKL